MNNFAKKFIAIIAVLCVVMSAIPVSAASKTIATKTFTNIGTIGSFSKPVSNYNGKGKKVSTGYTKAKLTFNSKFTKALSKFVKKSGCKYPKYGFTVLKTMPSSVTIKNQNSAEWGWKNSSCCDSTSATVKLIDTDGDGWAEKAKITILAIGKTTKKGTYATLVGSKIVRLTEYSIAYSL